jgi:hypothetical protein
VLRLAQGRAKLQACVVAEADEGDAELVLRFFTEGKQGGRKGGCAAEGGELLEGTAAGGGGWIFFFFHGWLIHSLIHTLR